MKGQFHRDFSERKTYEVFDMPGVEYAATTESIVEHFGLKRSEPLVTNAVDVAFAGFCLADAVVQLAWDNWSGFIVTAMNPDAEALVDQVAEYLEERK